MSLRSNVLNLGVAGAILAGAGTLYYHAPIEKTEVMNNGSIALVLKYRNGEMAVKFPYSDEMLIDRDGDLSRPEVKSIFKSCGEFSSYKESDVDAEDMKFWKGVISEYRKIKK